MDTNLHELFIQLVRVGVGAVESATIPEGVNWVQLKGLAAEQGLLSVVLDGMDRLNTNLTNGTNQIPKKLRLEWIGEVLQQEQVNAIQQKAAGEMALLFHENGIRTYVLKGAVIAECYPRPEHRNSVDMDCFLKAHTESTDNTEISQTNEEVWERGNRIVEKAGFVVKRDFYKNSTLFFPELTVENHKFLTPFRGNKKLMALERVLQALLRQDKGDDKFEGTYLYRPPVMVSALFLIEHAYSHFLHEGLTWRMVLDWVMFRKKHEEEIPWNDFEAYIDEFEFRRFYDVFNAIGDETFNENENSGSLRSKSFKNHNQNHREFLETSGTSDQSRAENLRMMMLNDIWAQLDVHETVTGVKGKLALVGNTWRARWKYRYFTEINWMQALWIQVKGVLFEKEPSLR